MHTHTHNTNSKTAPHEATAWFGSICNSHWLSTAQECVQQRASWAYYSEQSGQWTAQLLMLVSTPCFIVACLPQYPIATRARPQEVGSGIWEMSLDSTMSALRGWSSGVTTHPLPPPPPPPLPQWEMIWVLVSERKVREVFSVYVTQIYTKGHYFTINHIW